MNTANDEKRREIMQNVKTTCTSLASKIEQFHHKVIKPVEKAKDSVMNTVGSVTDTVSSTVSSAKHVVDTVGDHVSKSPWLAIAGSMVAGVGAGLLMGKSTPAPHASHNGYSAASSNHSEPGFISKQIKKLTGVAVGAGLATVRDLVKEHVPALSEAADSLVGDLTEQLGAVPYHGPSLYSSRSEPVSTL